MKTIYTTAAAAILLVLNTTAWGGVINDTFDTIDPAWTTDRYEPAGFSSVMFDGDNRLEIAIADADSAANRPSGYSGTFYNTQGRQRPASNGTTWTVSADLYISADMLSGDNLRRTDLWTRDSNPDENSAQYPIIGVIRNDDSDPFNPSASLTTRWRVWDGDTANGWVDLSEAVTAGWHTLSIKADGSTFDYAIDGSSVYVDSTVSAAGSAALQTVFLQAYNFGGQDYAVYWDNLHAVPEPASCVLVLGAAVGALGLLRRRRK